MNLDDFSTVVDDRRYINPQVALDESNAFIQKLRDTQSSRNEQIQRDTYNLGTAVPSNLGGLGGSQSYFNARYQTPQTNSLVADLKATAQAQALSDAMNNEIAKAKKRYNDAYKAYAKRNNNPKTNPTDPDKNAPDFKPSSEEKKVGDKKFAGSTAPIVEGEKGTASNLTEEQIKNIRDWAKMNMPVPLF